jgi:hypothetical protein
MTSPLGTGATATSRDHTVDATLHLARILDSMGDALVAVDVTALLAVESELGAAIAAIHPVAKVGDHAAVRIAADQALTALLRCRRLGASFSDIARALGRVSGATDGYDCMGDYVTRGTRASVLVRA